MYRRVEVCGVIIVSMRTLCDACESASAILFCPADKAALCRACDMTVHMVNKLASRHVRVGLANPVDIPFCDICENANGKRAHPRYLLTRQRVVFPNEADILEVPSTSQPMVQPEIKKPQNPSMLQLTLTLGHSEQNRRVPPVSIAESKLDGHARTGIHMIDLNRKPHQVHEQTSFTKYL